MTWKYFRCGISPWKFPMGSAILQQALLFRFIINFRTGVKNDNELIIENWKKEQFYKFLASTFRSPIYLFCIIIFSKTLIKSELQGSFSKYLLYVLSSIITHFYIGRHLLSYDKVKLEKRELNAWIVTRNFVFTTM